MRQLEGLTSHTAVEQAIAEYRSLGRTAFLRKHSLPRSKR